MSLRSPALGLLAGCLLALHVSHAQTLLSSGSGSPVRLGVDAAWDFMWIAYSTNIRNPENDTTWLSRPGWPLMSVSTNVWLDAAMSERLSAHMAFEGAIWFTLPKADAATKGLAPEKRGFAILRSAYGRYAFGTGDAAPALVIGYFPFNYSPEVHSLGAYLFKSGTYPGYVLSGNGNARLAGAHLRIQWPSLRIVNDFFVTSETEFEPRHDISLSYVLRYGVGGPLSLAAGVMFDRLFPVNTAKTRPKNPLRPQKTGDVDTFSVGGVDQYDTTWCRKSGVKLMARASFDIKSLLPAHNFPEQDLKLYAEAAVLGVKDYTSHDGHCFYDNIVERIPVMGGLNLPQHPITYGLTVAALSGFLIGSESDSTVVDTVGHWDSVYTEPPGGENFEWVDTFMVDDVRRTPVERGFTYKPYRLAIWGAVAAISGVGTYLLERTLGRRLRLDRLGVEVEYYGSPWRNDPNYEGLPIPNHRFYYVNETNILNDPDSDDPGSKGTTDNWKWAVMAQKTIRDRFTITGRVASDHLRAVSSSGGVDPEERLHGPNEWYWHLNFTAGF